MQERSIWCRFFSEISALRATIANLVGGPRCAAGPTPRVPVGARSTAEERGDGGSARGADGDAQGVVQIFGANHRLGVERGRNGHEDADDKNHYHQLDQGKSHCASICIAHLQERIFSYSDHGLPIRVFRSVHRRTLRVAIDIEDVLPAP